MSDTAHTKQENVMKDLCITSVLNRSYVVIPLPTYQPLLIKIFCEWHLLNKLKLKMVKLPLLPNQFLHLFLEFGYKVDLIMKQFFFLHPLRDLKCKDS